MHLGEMMYICALGNGFATDLLDKRSNIYSGRPRYISANDYLTENLTMVLSHHCDLYAIALTRLYFLTDPPP